MIFSGSHLERVLSGKRIKDIGLDRAKKVSLDRSERLIAELRNNLKRRKGQVTARREAGMLGEQSSRRQNKLIEPS